MAFKDWTWPDIEALRNRFLSYAFDSVEGAAQGFARDLHAASDSVILARVFLVLPFGTLPAAERAYLAEAADHPLGPKLRVLSLLGTAGNRPEWNDRLRSRGHRAIALRGSAEVQAIPMIAKLLADLEVDLAGLDDGKPIATRRLLGGRNGAFFVPDALAARDASGRSIVDLDFARAYDVRTVFGMGGAYADGTLAVAVVFTRELLERLGVERFPSLIGNFKIATASQLEARHVFSAAPPAPLA